MQLVRECHQQCQGPEVIELNPPGRLLGLGSRAAAPGLHHNNCFSLLTLSVERFPARASLFKHTQCQLSPPRAQQAGTQEVRQRIAFKICKMHQFVSFQKSLESVAGSVTRGKCDPAAASVRASVPCGLLRVCSETPMTLQKGLYLNLSLQNVSLYTLVL